MRCSVCNRSHTALRGLGKCLEPLPVDDLDALTAKRQKALRGETLEQAVHREVAEESGVRVRDLRYSGSQSWPFPSNLMLGFRAEWDSGDIVIQEEELMDAQFFHYRQLPMIPPPGSIAYHLIMACVADLTARFG